MIDFYKAIWSATGSRQTLNIVLALVIAGLAAVPLNYQKDIVNGLTYGTLTAPDLWALGLAMGAVILLSLGLKWVLGYLASRLGEDMIRSLRNSICRAPSDGSNSAALLTIGMRATMTSAEAEQVGKFSGSALSEPLLQAGTLAVIVGYIASNDPALGLIALAMIFPQVIVVLFAQSRVNALVAARVHTLREATNELVSGTSSADAISVKFDDIFDTRIQIFKWKLSSKFVLSAINGAGTVGVLLVGGLHVLDGTTDVGTVVAATIGLARLQGPTKQLVAFYRQVSAIAVKFKLLQDADVHMIAQPT